MKKIHCCLLFCLLLITLLVIVYQYKKPNRKCENASAKFVERVLVFKAETSTPLENRIESYVAEDVQETRTLSQEDIRAISAEYGRLTRILIALGGPIEHEVNQTAGQFYYLMGYLLGREKPMIKKTNERLNIIPHYMFDIREGEIRFPPLTLEYANLLQELHVLMDKPEQTDEEDARIRQIAWGIYDMVKTNTPTSIFQMPEGKEE